jgi:hypothetical protein
MQLSTAVSAASVPPSNRRFRHWFGAPTPDGFPSVWPNVSSCDDVNTTPCALSPPALDGPICR